VTPRHTILPLSTRYIDRVPSNSHLLHHRRWCHMANKLTVTWRCVLLYRFPRGRYVFVR